MSSLQNQPQSLQLIIIPKQGQILSKITSKLDRVFKITLNKSIKNQIVTKVLIYFSDTTTSQFIYQASLKGKSLGLDGISLWLQFLVNIVIPIVQLNGYKNQNIVNQQSKKVNYQRIVKSIGLLSNKVFLVQDLVLFFISFEAVLIPKYYLIAFYGGSNKRIKAQYLLIIYTLAGSQFQLCSIIFIYKVTGTTSYQLQQLNPIKESYQQVLFLGFLIAFAVKLPTLPFHIWLPVVHSESPTGGSVILAAILLKLGSYGQKRFTLPLFPYAAEVFTPQVLVISIKSIVYASQAAKSLIDQKQIIAYSSIIHKNKSLVGLFSNSLIGILGSYVYSITHGQIASAQFQLVGVLYERYHTRNIKYYRGLVIIFPKFVTILFIFTLKNTSFPLTAGFVPELLIYLSSINISPKVLVLASSAICLLPFYFKTALHRISYGSLSPYQAVKFSDLNIKEFHLFLPLLFLGIFLGIYPQQILNYLYYPCLCLIY